MEKGFEEDLSDGRQTSELFSFSLREMRKADFRAVVAEMRRGNSEKYSGGRTDRSG